VTALRVIAQGLAVPVALAAAVIAQLAVVNRLPLPGGTGPDLVLLVVVAVAVSTGPTTGMLAGFAGGLALDVAPPASHLAGEYALVFCLVGYACGRARKAITHAAGELTMWAALVLMAVGIAVGEAGKVALGLMLSDPNVTGPAVKHLLPVAIFYDLLLCPFVLWLVSVVLRRPAPAGAPRPELTQIAAAFRVASAGSVGAVPKLRLAGSTPLPARPPARQEPKLRLSGTSAAFSPAQPTVSGGRPVKLNFSQASPAAGKPRQSTSPGKGWVRAARPSGQAAPRRSSPGKGWLRVTRPTGSPVSNLSSPGKGWLRAGPPAVTPAPKFRSPGKGWLVAGRPAAAAAPKFTSPGKSPGKGWLRAGRPAVAATPKRSSPPKGWIRQAKPVPPPRRKSPGRGWLRPAKPASRNVYAKSPSTRWVRHSHSPWPGRRRRLLALMGGRR
jgi:rod shape-determining protein MreD